MVNVGAMKKNCLLTDIEGDSTQTTSHVNCHAVKVSRAIICVIPNYNKQ